MVRGSILRINLNVQKLPEIKAAYEKLDGLIQGEIADAVKAADTMRESKMVEFKTILDYAFFVLCFAQFERGVTIKFEEARDRRAGNPDWARRRGWDLSRYENAVRLPFEDRVAMVLDRNDSDFGRIVSHYATRNHVAHGGLSEPIAPLDQFISDLFTLFSKLKS